MKKFILVLLVLGISSVAEAGVVRFAKKAAVKSAKTAYNLSAHKVVKVAKKVIW